MVRHVAVPVLLLLFMLMAAANPPNEIQTVHLVFQTHFDLGFTNMSRTVCEQYFFDYFLAAIETVQQVKALKSGMRFVYNTQPWLLLEFFDGAAGCTSLRPTAQQIAQMEQFIRDGDVTYQGLSMNVFTELLDPSLFAASLDLAHQLDKRFGLPLKHTASIKDVMGASISSVPLYAAGNYTALHIGANSACTAAAVPPAFVWRHPATQTELLTMVYNRPSNTTPCSVGCCVYGGDVIVPGFKDALVYYFTLDNRNPPNVTDVVTAYETLQKQFPQASIVASSLDAFADQLATFKAHLPVITAEMGDTWAYGVAADPWKMAAHRALSRLRLRLLTADPALEHTVEMQSFTRRMMKLAEHNWGLDTERYLSNDHYFHHWRNEDFHALLTSAAGEDYRLQERAWREQRSFATAGDTPQSWIWERADAELAELIPRVPDVQQCKRVQVDSVFTAADVNFRFNSTSGAVQLLGAHSGNFGGFAYQTYSMHDFDVFTEQYLPGCGFPCGAFSKPGMQEADARHATWPSLVRTLWQCEETEQSARFVVEVQTSAEAHDTYGAPETVFLEYWLRTTAHNSLQLEFELQWFNKTATRLAESAWTSFTSLCDNSTAPCQCHIDVQSYDINPLDVISNGSRRLHAALSGFRCQTGTRELSVHTVDAPLVAPGDTEHLLMFDDSLPDVRAGMHINVYNNLWGTAFPQWYGDNAKFRFRVEMVTESE